MKRPLAYILAFVCAALLLAGAFAGGVAVSQVVDVQALLGVPRPDSSLGEQVEEVERLINTQALQPSSEESMTAGTIAGLLEALDDPYAMYFNPEHFAYFNEQNDGEFFGVGVTIAEREGVVYVVSVIEGTPAEAAGVKAYDEFIGIDGVEHDPWTVDDVVKAVRGPAGTTVEVQMRRPDPEDPAAEPEILDFTIERARVEIPNITSRMEGEDIGYIRLLSFNARSVDDLREAIADLEGQGAKGLVLDVRDNPGGLLDASIDAASLFIDDGVIVQVEERYPPVVEHRATVDKVTDAPLVLLINGNSASASEVLGGALQDYGRATLVGEQSFGKGSVQTVERLSFGGGVKYTIAHYLTPKGRIIDGVGLTPDVIVEMEPELQREEADDTQLQRAFEVVRDEL